MTLNDRNAPLYLKSLFPELAVKVNKDTHTVGDKKIASDP